MYEQYLPDIDVNDGVMRVLDNKRVYLNLLNRFKAREMVDGLLREIETGAGPEKIAATAHSLKGTVSNLALLALTEVTRDIISCANNGGGCKDLAASLKDAMDAFEKKKKALFENENFSMQ